MKYTAETRWFYAEADADEAIRKWFSAHGRQFSGKNKRTDHYLLDSSNSKGIKLRDDRLEIKINAHNWVPEILNFENYNKANSWKKYSFVLAKDDEEASELIRSFAGLRSIGVNNDWVRIDKERLSIKFATNVDEETVEEVEENATPLHGCTVDYTRLQVNLRSNYLSFGFEAFGDGMMVKKSLDLVVAEVLQAAGVRGLSQDLAMSYPEFVAKGGF